MDKQQAASVIIKSAETYNNWFNNQNLLVICGVNKETSFQRLSFIEITSTDSRFLHLTGVELNPNDPTLDKASFFTKALNKQLTPNDFSFKDDTTILKLKVLEQALDIPKNFRMFGNYDSGRPFLQTDKLIGGVKSSIGFAEDDCGYYVPNTVLNGDIRQEVKEAQQVLAVLQKDTADHEYTEIKYLAKNVYAHKLLETLKTQNPQIPLEPLRVNYQSLLESQQTKEAEFIRQEKIIQHKETIKAVTDKMAVHRNAFIMQEKEDDLQVYFNLQERLTELVDKYELYDYAIDLLKEQAKENGDNDRIRSEIEKEIANVQKAQTKHDTAGRTATITININGRNTGNGLNAVMAGNEAAALAESRSMTFHIPIPPKKPFKALYIKIKDAIKDFFSKGVKDDGDVSESLPINPKGGGGDGGGQTSLKEDKTEDKAVEPEKTAVSKTPDVLQSPVNDTDDGVRVEAPPEQNSSERLKEPVPETPAPVVEAVSAKKEAKPKTKKSRQFEYGD